MSSIRSDVGDPTESLIQTNAIETIGCLGLTICDIFTVQRGLVVLWPNPLGETPVMRKVLPFTWSRSIRSVSLYHSS